MSSLHPYGLPLASPVLPKSVRFLIGLLVKCKCIRTWITDEVRGSDGGKELMSRVSITNARERTTISQPAAIVFRQNNSNCVVHQVG